MTKGRSLSCHILLILVALALLARPVRTTVSNEDESEQVSDAISADEQQHSTLEAASETQDRDHATSQSAIQDTDQSWTKVPPDTGGAHWLRHANDISMIDESSIRKLARGTRRAAPAGGARSPELARSSRAAGITGELQAAAPATDDAADGQDTRRLSGMTSTTTSISTTADSNEEPAVRALKCRVEKDFYLDFDEYRHYSCANCYNIVPAHLFWQKLSLREESRGWLFDEQSGMRLLPNESKIVGATFKSNNSLNLWQACCSEALECCKRNARHLPATRDPRGHLIDDQTLGTCPATWDGLSCWPATKAASWAKQTCPDHAYVLHEFVPVCKGTVQKQCFANGSWYIRYGHEWSDYKACKPEPLYGTRMRVGGLWHVISAIFIWPALLVMNRLPNRHKSKRVKIMTNILFWLLLLSLCNASYKFGVASKFFQPNMDHSHRREQNEAEPTRPSWTTLGQLINASSGANFSIQSPASNQAPASIHNDFDQNNNPLEPLTRRHARHSDADLWLGELDSVFEPASQGYEASRGKVAAWTSDAARSLAPRRFGKANGQSQLLVFPEVDAESARLARWKRNDQSGESSTTSTQQPEPQPQQQTDAGGSSGTGGRKKWKQSAPIVVFFCWLVCNGMRLTRSLSYAWMFTGAVYLCSILHYAPAEPPAVFIKTLMILTNGFPMVLALAYIIIRTVYEPSPLKLFVKLPYYYAINDKEAIKNLWASELSCWILRAEDDNIEFIAEFPNYIFVALNAALFIATLFIMCNISRPGSTRNDMSIRDYFKAAGTLVLLYGTHASLLAAVPEVPEGCLSTQAAYYVFVFVDGIQGMAVSYVFCYRTAEGREVIHKWWLNMRGYSHTWRRVSCDPGGSQRRRSKGSISGNHHHHNGHDHGNRNRNNHHSARSNNYSFEAKGVTTELINIDGSSPDHHGGTAGQNL